jgi:type I restriction enzyme S subunit
MPLYWALKNILNTWVQRRLGNVFDHILKYVNPQEKNMELWSLTVENGLTPKTNRYNRRFLVKKNDKFNVVNPCNFVYNPMNMTLGAVGYNSMSKSVAVSGYYVIMRTKENFDDQYLNAWISSSKAIRLYKLYATGSLIEKQRVQFSTLSTIQTYFPLTEEQKKIGHFFCVLNSLITANQRKNEMLKAVKKGHLHRIYNQKLRFKDHYGLWQELHLTAIIKRILKTSGVPTLPRIEFEDIISNEGRLNKDVTKKQDIRPGIVFKSGDILYGKLRPYLNNWLYANFTGIALGDFWVLRPKSDVDSLFVYYLIQSPKYQRVANISTGTKMPRSDWKIVSETKFSIPINRQEQVKIGIFFNTIDELITNQQMKIDKLQHLKESYLQQMFI